jgi:hypothetical protein
MKINIQGLVANSQSMLKKHGPLLPLYEATVNAIHSIDEKRRIDPSHKGEIVIHLARDLAIAETKVIPNLTSITNNGIGFHDDNFKSFETSYSSYKQEIGGKGLGRFSYLVGFEKAKIESVYVDNSLYYKRSFDFVPTDKGIENALVSPVDEQLSYTRLELIGFRKFSRANNHSEIVRKKTITIARRIMQHCALMFVLDKVPTIKIYDSSLDADLCVNDVWNREIKSDSKKVDFSVKNHTFSLSLLYVYNSDESSHEIKLCGNEREVLSRNVNEFLRFIPKNKKLDGKDERSGHKFVISALDENINASRDGFNFDGIHKSDDSFFGEDNDFVTQDEIFKAASEKISDLLSDYVKSIKEANYEDNVIFINNNPAFVIFKDPKYKSQLENISSHLNKSEKETIFRKMKYDLDSEIADIYKYFSSDLKNASNLDVFKSKTKAILTKINESNRSSLAEYVTHRKILLDVLKQNLNLTYDSSKQKESYHLEKDIHELIMPLGTDSSKVRFEDHNLWVIEETLAFHHYISSDEKINQIPIMNSDSKDRMDIVAFNTGYVTANSKEPLNIDSVTIIEFKRPGRNDYIKGNPEKDPHEQAIKYIAYIRDNGLKTIAGRNISSDKISNIPIYVYIIADIEPSLKKILDGNSFSRARCLLLSQ